MIKRPSGTWVVTAWVALLLFLFARMIVGLLTGHTGATRIAQNWNGIVFIMYSAFVVYLAVGLFRLRLPHLWLSIALLAWLALSAAIALPKLLIAGGPVPAILTASAILVVNSVVIWYLVRPSFRAIARQYCSERDQDRVRRRAEKMIRESSQR